MKKIFFIAPLCLTLLSLFALCDNAMAASRAPTGRAMPVARKSVASATQTTTQTVEEEVVQEVEEEIVDDEPEIINKSSQFEVAISSSAESSVPNNSFAEQIRKQRAALAAKDAMAASESEQQQAVQSGSTKCDSDLRKCMINKCGKDFTKCALDDDTIFGDKLNLCKRDTTCSAEEFRLFTTEIKADRDMNARLSSYENVINCGNQYNACIVNECGTTYNKCLGKPYADAAIQKCATIAKECTESDSGLANRFGTAIGKLRENAEVEVKRDEARLYELRDLMQSACKGIGAMFDERTFDCIFTVNFFAGEKQDFPTASRKRYAGDTFVCMQEWFGIDATTYKENAARLTKSQSAASSAMLGSGTGMAAGLISSGAIGRALDTQKAKKELKAEEKAQKADEKAAEKAEKDAAKAEKKAEKDQKKQEAKEKKEEECQDGGGKLVGLVCDCTKAGVGFLWNSKDKQCKKPEKPNIGKKGKSGDTGGTASSSGA